ncbi:aminopeptidase P N-terminal domain-containing protein [Algoriphagus boritolerans]|uniref:aminopeptidase P N-terminal domain-containing protein n=1 Tax=Algoriphagus boritolerans TaxID=308111 RepID=UPI002FCE198C
MSTFPKDTYIERRNRLKQKVGTGILLFLGNEESSSNFKDNWYPFRQDSSFLYFFWLRHARTCSDHRYRSGLGNHLWG